MTSGFGEIDIIGAKTITLLNAITNWLIFLVPVIAGLFVVLQLIKKSAATQEEQLGYDKRIRNIVISAIAAMVAVALIKMITNWFAPGDAAAAGEGAALLLKMFI